MKNFHKKTTNGDIGKIIMKTKITTKKKKKQNKLHTSPKPN